MTATDAAAVLDLVTGTVSYLRAETGPATDAWLACDRLVADAPHLLAVARSTAGGRGTDEDDVAVSLFVQAHAFRIASLGIGGWLLADRVLDLAPGATAVLLARHRPNAVGFRSLRLVEGPDPLAELVRVVVDGHLAPLVATAHATTPIGERLLWGNVAAACAASFGAFHGALPPEARPEVRARAAAFLAAAPAPLRTGGRFTSLGEGWWWERSSCCLWYRTASGSRCEDCSLWTDEERRARYEAEAGR